MAKALKGGCISKERNILQLKSMFAQKIVKTCKHVVYMLMNDYLCFVTKINGTN